LSRNGNDGILQNFAFQSGSGYEDGLLINDGIDETFMAPYVPYLSLEFLVKSPLIQTTTSRYPTLFNQNNQTTTGSFIWMLQTPANSRNLTIQIGNGGYSNLSAIKFFDFDEMVHAVFVFSQANLKIYKNGILLSTLVFPKGCLPPNNGPMFFGRYGGVHTSQNSFAMIRAYILALTPVEIQHNYQMEKERWNL
jgi:hypothetical protein